MIFGNAVPPGPNDNVDPDFVSVFPTPSATLVTGVIAPSFCSTARN